MAQRSKMERGNAESETSSSPATYQCIVCQMTTISLSRLHRHQTYQHTPEELSLSTIGLQCSLINNIRAINSIIYDNSWLSDPLQQAEFYTVSANLLNDCNNNPNICDPVDYVVEKDDHNFKEEGNVEIADEQEMRDFDFRIDHSYGRVVNFAEEFPKNETQIKRFRGIGTQASGTEFVEEVHQPKASSTLCTETERIITYLEEVMQVEETITIGTEANYDSKPPGKITEAEESKAVNAVPTDNFHAPENEMQAEESKDIRGQTAARKIKVAEPKVNDPEANTIFKSPEKETETDVQQFKVPEARSIVKSAKKKTEAEELKVPEADPKSAVKDVNVVKPEADPFADCIESLCIDLEKMKSKPPKRKRAPPRNPAPRKAKAAAKPRAPRKKVKTSDFLPENNTVKQGVDQQIEISAKHDPASMHCTELSQKTSVEPPTKRAKMSHSVPANVIIKQEVDRETQIPVKNHCPHLNSGIQKTENFAPLRKKAKISHSGVGSTIIMQDAPHQSKIPTQNDFASMKPTEFNLESQKSENSVQLSKKKDKTSNSVIESTTDMQDAEIKTAIGVQNDFANMNHTEMNLQSQRSGNLIKKIFSEEDIVEAQLKGLFQQQTETQDTEVSPTDNSASSHWIEYHVMEMEPPILDGQALAHDKFIQHYVDTCKAEIPAEIPVEVKSEEQEFAGDEVNDPRNSEHPDDSVIAALHSTYTFPWCPPDINDYSILVLDPEAQQLVWTKVAIVDEKMKLQNKNSMETVVLPELTEADLRDNEICETMTISSGSQTKERSENLLRSQTKESSGNLLRSQSKGIEAKTRKKTRTNFVLRPRKPLGNKKLQK